MDKESNTGKDHATRLQTSQSFVLKYPITVNGTPYYELCRDNVAAEEKKKTRVWGYGSLVRLVKRTRYKVKIPTAVCETNNICSTEGLTTMTGKVSYWIKYVHV